MSSGNGSVKDVQKVKHSIPIHGEELDSVPTTCILGFKSLYRRSVSAPQPPIRPAQPTVSPTRSIPPVDTTSTDRLGGRVVPTNDKSNEVEVFSEWLNKHSDGTDDPTLQYKYLTIRVKIGNTCLLLR